MRPIIILVTIFAGILLSSRPAAAQQQADSLRRKAPELSAAEQKHRQLGYYKRSLNIDSAKAEQVNRVQDEYKAAMKTLEAESLTPEARRGRIKALMEEKNRRLGTLLSPQQQEKIIPPTERMPQAGAKRDSTRKNR